MLSRDPRVVVVSQPTRGLDVGATEYVRSELLARRAAGSAILLVSEDLDELLALSDRVIVLYEGRIVGDDARRGRRPRAPGDADGRTGRRSRRTRRVTRAIRSLAAPPWRALPWSTPGLVLMALAITFLLTAGPIALAGANPISAYAEFLVVPLTSRFSILEVLVTATPLLLTGTAVALAFRGGYWNIGAEGQLLVGAIVAAAIGQIAGFPRSSPSRS